MCIDYRLVIWLPANEAFILHGSAFMAILAGGDCLGLVKRSWLAPSVDAAQPITEHAYNQRR
jgi:hypothetical protein